MANPSETTRIPVESTAFDEHTPVDTIVAYVDTVKQNPRGKAEALIPLLSEGHRVYSNRTANELLRLRGYAMAALERTELPDAAMQYVLENLESAFHPYSVAAAARALRGIEKPEPRISQYLLKAIFNIWQVDKPVSFTSYHVEWPQREFATGLTEIFETLTHFGSHAKEVLPVLERLAQNESENLSDRAHACLLKCIDAIREDEPGAAHRQLTMPRDTAGQGGATRKDWPPQHLVLEDQDGVRLGWNEFFRQKPTVLGFFYTRCGNPQKCTRTIFNLAGVQDEVANRGLSGQVRVCAMTYDYLFDTPAALRSYGDARNFRFDDDYRMFRVPEGFDRLVEQMGLEVSYSGSQVTSHRIEIFVLDQACEVVDSFVRLQSDPSRIVDALASLI